MLRQDCENFLREMIKEDGNKFSNDFKFFPEKIKKQKDVYVFLNDFNRNLSSDGHLSPDSFEILKRHEFFSFELFLTLFVQAGGDDEVYNQVKYLARKIDENFKKWDDKIISIDCFFEDLLEGLSLSQHDFACNFSEEDVEKEIFLLSLFLFFSKLDAFLFARIASGKLKNGLSARPISFGWVMMKQFHPLKYAYDNGLYIAKNEHKAKFSNPNLVISWLLATFAFREKEGVFPEKLYGLKDFFDIAQYKCVESERSKSSFLKKFKEGGKAVSLFDFIWLLKDDEFVFDVSEELKKDPSYFFEFDVDQIECRANGKHLGDAHYFTILWFIYRFFFLLFKNTPEHQAILFGQYHLLWKANLANFGIVEQDIEYAEWPEEIRELARFKQVNEPTTDSNQ